MAIEKGNNVKIEYEGKLDNGQLFDKTQDDALEFQIGGGTILPAFENALIGMEKGQEKEIKLQPLEAYGERKDELVREIPKEQLPQEELKPGMLLVMSLPNGNRFPVKILEIGDETAKIDFNHPLAGQVLNFKIKILDVSEGDKAEGAEFIPKDEPEEVSK